MKEVHETLLYVVHNLHMQNQIITVGALRKPLGWLQNLNIDLENELNWLVDQGFLVKNNELELTLTEIGKKEALRINEIRSKDDFNRLIGSAIESITYLDYCAELYGYRMPLFNMMDKEQLDYLFKTIPFAKSDRVLDLGCGTGSVLNYLIQKYNFCGTGIDRLNEAIVKKYSNRISYIEGDIDDFTCYKLKPNITLSVDSIYFSNDLNGLVGALKKIKNNRLFIYYSQYIFDESTSDKSVLHCDHTRIAAILQQHNYPFRVIDYSANEHSLYEKALKILPKYKNAFEGEGNIFIYENKLRESRSGKEMYDKGLASRYLYIVE